MQTFTYHKHGRALKDRIFMLLLLLVAESVFWIGVAMLVPHSYRWLLLSCCFIVMLAAGGVLTRPLRTRHRLDESSLQLAMGSFRYILPRQVIARARRCTRPLPRSVSVPTLLPAYSAETDGLFLLADRRGLVELELAEPGEVRLRHVGTVQFARVMLSLDEPDAFLQALSAATEEGRLAAEAGGATRSEDSLAEGARFSAAPLIGSDRNLPAAFQLTGLCRRFGDFPAVQNLTFSVAPGEILAFLGSNGAGKTTTIRMMVGLLRPSNGQVLIQGRDLWAEGAAVRRLVGYVPDAPLLYDGLTAREYLWLVAGLYNMSRAEGRQRTDELLAMLKLERFSDHLIRNFSLGMKRKMAIAAGLIHRPRVLLLDEVTNGLDPRAAREVKDLILAASRQGVAVFLTTHLLDLAAELASRIAVIDQGELRAIGTVSDLQDQAGLPGAGLEALFLALTGGEATA